MEHGLDKPGLALIVRHRGNLAADTAVKLEQRQGGRGWGGGRTYMDRSGALILFIYYECCACKMHRIHTPPLTVSCPPPTLNAVF